MMESVIKTVQEVTFDKEKFWKDHANLQRRSDLSRLAYCRIHQLNYDTFGYWEKKWRQASPVRLLPVNFDALPKINARQQPEVICTLTLKNGHALKVHDQKVLPLLLSLLG